MEVKGFQIYGDDQYHEYRIKENIIIVISNITIKNNINRPDNDLIAGYSEGPHFPKIILEFLIFRCFGG